MNRRSWLKAGLVGTALGLVVACVMAFVDWRHNPGGIFHDELGTSWNVVFETAFSWFAPVALTTFGLSVLVLWWSSRS